MWIILLISKGSEVFRSSFFTATFNAGYDNGDEDWFVYKAKKTEQATLTLAAGNGIDGIIEVYRDGKRVAKSDYYGNNDNETFTIKLSKGTYYIKVKDHQGHASFSIHCQSN